MNYQLVNDLTSIFNNVLVIEESSLRGSQFKDVSIKEMHTIDALLVPCPMRLQVIFQRNC